MNIDSRSFRNAMACFASGITVVTTSTPDGRKLGLTVSAFSSLSLEPPLVLVCLDKRTSDIEDFRAGYFGVNVLREDQKEVSIRFATRNGDKWSKTPYEIGDCGCPLIKNCLANLECAVETVYDGGDHVIVVGRVVRLAYSAGGQPLIYFRSSYAEIGRAL